MGFFTRNSGGRLGTPKIFRHVRCFSQEESHGNQHVEMGRKTGWFSCNDPINAEDEHRMVPPQLCLLVYKPIWI
jgi:hypothetical protein